MDLKIGQKIEIRYKDKIFPVVVINPHAFGHNRPSIGFNYSSQEKYAGLSHATLNQWVKGAKKLSPSLFSEGDVKDIEHLKLPRSRMNYVVHPIPLYTENTTNQFEGGGKILKVIEISEFVDLCFNIICFEDVNPSTKKKIKDFLQWFTVKGFYAEAFTFIKGSFDRADSQMLEEWLMSRLSNKEDRKPYAKFLVDLEENPAFWTNFVYLYLFGKIASEMRTQWRNIAGKADIARNHIPESIGLEAIGFVERTIVDIYTGNLREAHLFAVQIAVKKFKLPSFDAPDENKLFSAYPTLKLSTKDVANIVELCEGGFTFREIAEEYGVCESTIKYHCQRKGNKKPNIYPN